MTGPIVRIVMTDITEPCIFDMSSYERVYTYARMMKCDKLYAYACAYSAALAQQDDEHVTHKQLDKWRGSVTGYML